MFVRFLCVLLSPCLAYNQTIGLQLAYLEKAVYCGQEAFDKWQVGESVVKGPKVNTSQLRFITSSEQAAAGVGRMLEPDGCFVAMRGTFGVISSLLDAVFWPMDFEHALCPSCQVDSGFYLAYLSVRDKIFRALADFGCHQRPLYLVGHSQGAASLTYLLFDALMKAFTVQHMYALESPRPGNGKFAEALGKLLGKTDAWRVVHYQDIVPHLPPPGGLFGYEHALPEIYYPQRVGAKYVECGLEDLKCSSQWWPWQLTGGDHDWYADIDPCVCAVQEEANPLNFLSGPFFT